MSTPGGKIDAFLPPKQKPIAARSSRFRLLNRRAKHAELSVSRKAGTVRGAQGRHLPHRRRFGRE